MLDEGLNQYWDLRMLLERKKPMPIGNGLMRRLGLDTSSGLFEAERIGASTVDPADPIGNNSWDRYSSGSYGSVYSRTATLMHDLEAHLGKPTTERAFKEYYRRWRFRHPGIADLQQTLAEVSGRPALVNAYFAQQVYATQKVDGSRGEIHQRGTDATAGHQHRQRQMDRAHGKPGRCANRQTAQRLEEGASKGARLRQRIPVPDHGDLAALRSDGATGFAGALRRRQHQDSALE